MSLTRNCTAADLVQQFSTTEAPDAEAILATLIVDIAVPLVRQTVKRRFSSARNTTQQDFEDVCADSVSAIIVRLRRHREGDLEIVEFERYAATVASNTADRFFASRAPQRARLRNRIRYVLTTDARFVIRESANGEWLCGFSGEKPDSPVLSGAAVEACRVRLSVSRPSTDRLGSLIRDVFAIAGSRLELTDLTTFAAHALGVTDQTEAIDDHADRLPDRAVQFAHSTELKDRLTRLWNEVRQLPLLQRLALLLNLGSGAGSMGDATMCSLVDLGITTFRALAQCIELTETELATIWNRVPLPDNEIAGRLQIERQQVINLRASARQRLTRRMNVIDNTGSRANTEGNPNTMGLSE